MRNAVGVSVAASSRWLSQVARWAVAALLIALLATVLASVRPQAAQADSLQTLSVSASLRAAQLAPQTQAVDVYLSSSEGTQLWVPKLGYGAVSAYTAVQPGTYTVSVRTAGAAASAPALLSWQITVAAAQAYTAAVMPAGTHSGITGAVLTDDLSPVASGKTELRLIQAASNARVAMLSSGGQPLASQVAFGNATSYLTLPAGSWPLVASGGGTSTSLTVSAVSGSINSVVLLNAPGGGLVLKAILDGAAAPAVPAGSVPAGGGGTAVLRAATLPLLGWLLIGVGVMAAITLLTMRPLQYQLNLARGIADPDQLPTPLFGRPHFGPRFGRPSFARAGRAYEHLW